MRKQEYKYQQVYREILNSLRDGRYNVGDRLPSERELSRQLNVNIVTVRRGYRELTLAGIVERKVGSGAYLRRLLVESPSEKPVTFAFDSSIGTQVAAFIGIIPGVMHESGRDYRFMLLDGNRVEEQIKSNIGYDMPMVFLSGARKYLRLMQSAPHLFVVMSLRGDQDGIPSVVCDDDEGICGLMSALRELGHRRIALLSSHSSDPLGQISSWRQAMGGEYSPELYLQMPQTQGALMDDARRVVREALQKTSFSALFTLGDELSVGAFAGINDCGLRVPEDISVVSITDSQLHRNLCPDVTVYDPDLAGHVRGALSMLEANAANPDGIELLRRIKPVLYFRGSSARCALPLQQFPEF